MNENILATSSVVTAFVRRGDTTSTTEADALPSVEEFIPRNSDAKPDLQRPPEAMSKVFRSSLMAERLVEFMVKYVLPSQVELVPVGTMKFTLTTRVIVLYLPTLSL